MFAVMVVWENIESWAQLHAKQSIFRAYVYVPDEEDDHSGARFDLCTVYGHIHQHRIFYKHNHWD